MIQPDDNGMLSGYIYGKTTVMLVRREYFHWKASLLEGYQQLFFHWENLIKSPFWGENCSGGRKRLNALTVTCPVKIARVEENQFFLIEFIG